MNTSGMGALIISVYKKWCGIIQGCGTIKIISRTKDKTLQIVPQCGTIRGCGTNRVNTVFSNTDLYHWYKIRIYSSPALLPSTIYNKQCRPLRFNYCTVSVFVEQLNIPFSRYLCKVLLHLISIFHL